MTNLRPLIICLCGIIITACNSLVEKSQPPAIYVTCQTLETDNIVDSSQFVGSLQARQQAVIKAENEGKISQILVQPGESVNAGTTIFLLDTGSQIKAPISGKIAEISVNIGEFITKGQILTSIINNQTLDLKINVPIEKLSQLKIGLPVEIIDSSGNTSSKSQINFISPKVNQQGIMAKAIVYNNKNFRTNQIVTVRLIWEQKPAILIPVESVSRIAGESIVFIVKEHKKSSGSTSVAESRLVELGNIQGKQYQVVSGLKVGEKLIVSNILNLSDGIPTQCSNNF
jgi:multidrug efflux pump subunit AcrA (membrane-fusion protein)